MSDSDLLCTVEEIAEFLRRPVSTVRSWTKEMLREDVLFWALRGKPPQRILCGFKEDVKSWYKVRCEMEERRRKDRKELPEGFVPEVSCP